MLTVNRWGGERSVALPRPTSVAEEWDLDAGLRSRGTSVVPGVAGCGGDFCRRVTSANKRLSATGDIQRQATFTDAIT